MLEAPQPPGGTRSVEDTTAEMQRIIDQAMDLLARALVSFAHDIGAEVVSEGIERARQ